MLQFEPFSDTLLIKILPYIRKSRSLCSEFSAGYLYMWNGDTDVRFSIRNETLSICETIGEQVAFSYPIGSDPVPTLLADVDFSAKESSGKYVCSICGYVYDPAEHDGVAFEDLPDDWKCPRCKQPKDKFNEA